MGLLWFEIKCLKSAVTLFFKAKSNLSLFRFLNELLCILVAQGATKLVEQGQSESSEKNPGLVFGLHLNGADRAEQQNCFSDLKLWHLVVLQSLKLQGCIISHLKVLLLEQLDLKSLRALLVYFSPIKEPSFQYCLCSKGAISNPQCAPGVFNLDQKFRRQNLFFLLTIMQNKLESVKKIICHQVSLWVTF